MQFKCWFFADHEMPEKIVKDNITFTEQDLMQAVSLAQFSYAQLKT